MRWLRLPLRLVGAIIAVIAVYLFASLVGAVIPSGPGQVSRQAPGETIYLLTTPLHADFAIPADDRIRRRFAFLGKSGIPIDDPRLEFLVFGWGSRAFYTTARTYADIRAGPTLRAIIGDRSVLHVVPAGDISGRDNAYRVTLPPGGISRLADFVERGFAGNPGNRHHLAGQGYGFGDSFFEANGHFNIVRPCNVWAAEGLRQAGLATGIWTPTTYSLILGLRLHSADAVGDPLP